MSFLGWCGVGESRMRCTHCAIDVGKHGTRTTNRRENSTKCAQIKNENTQRAHPIPLTNSRQNRVHHFTRYIGQAIVAALETEGQASMIDSELLQDSCLEIM